VARLFRRLTGSGLATWLLDELMATFAPYPEVLEYELARTADESGLGDGSR
jgi:hypothetical protein